jgi:hypothetical protein
MEWKHNMPNEAGWYWLSEFCPFKKKYIEPTLYKIEETSDGDGFKILAGDSYYGITLWYRPTDFWYGPVRIFCPGIPNVTQTT